jgi:hypothetical protein
MIKLLWCHFLILRGDLLQLTGPYGRPLYEFLYYFIMLMLRYDNYESFFYFFIAFNGEKMSRMQQKWSPYTTGSQ